MHVVLECLDIVQACFDRAISKLNEDGHIEESESLNEATVHWLRHTGISEDVKRFQTYVHTHTHTHARTHSASAYNTCIHLHTHTLNVNADIDIFLFLYRTLHSTPP